MGVCERSESECNEGVWECVSESCECVGKCSGVCDLRKIHVPWVGMHTHTHTLSHTLIGSTTNTCNLSLHWGHSSDEDNSCWSHQGGPQAAPRGRLLQGTSQTGCSSDSPQTDLQWFNPKAKVRYVHGVYSVFQ